MFLEISIDERNMKFTSIASNRLKMQINID
jgi:hypothetical protein